MKLDQHNFFKLGILWLPTLIYVGKRSYISQDEGFYALQARWILDKGNWLAPMWWNEIDFDRAIGVQWLIALSQKVFGQNLFASHLPSLLCAFISLIATYQLSKEFVGKNYSLLSPFLLSTTYLWINNAHLATQDMPLLALEMVGIVSIVKAKNDKSQFTLILSSLWIGLALLIKSFMVIIPLIAISPYLIKYRINILKSKSFWIGLSLGLLPAITWLILAINEFGYQVISSQFNKLIYLSSSSTFSHPFYYYLWNIPINTLPWSILFIVGMFIIIKSKDYIARYILVYYPLIIILLLSLFNTKTPYYALQITPFIAINSSIAIKSIFTGNHNNITYFKKALSFTGLIFIICSIYLLIFSKYHSWLANNTNITLYSIIGLILGMLWLFLILTRTRKTAIILTILGPYISYCITVQSGILCDRSPEIASIVNSSELSRKLNKQRVHFLFSNKLDNDEYSKLIKLAIYTPILGKRLTNIQQVNTGDLIWSNIDKTVDKNKNLQIIYTDEKLKPWILIKNDS